MQFPNPWVEEGRVLGLQEGLQEGRQDLILRLLKRRFGMVPVELVERIGGLSDSQMELFSESFLDFQNLADVKDWIACHA